MLHSVCCCRLQLRLRAVVEPLCGTFVDRDMRMHMFLCTAAPLNADVSCCLLSCLQSCHTAYLA